MTQLPPRGDRAGVRRWSLWDGTRWVWSTRPLSPEHPLVPCSMRMTLTVESTSLVPWIWVVTVHSRLRKQVANNGNSWEIGVVALERVGGLCSRGTPSWTRPPPPTGRELVCGAMQSQCKGPFFFFVTVLPWSTNISALKSLKSLWHFLLPCVILADKYLFSFHFI